MKQKKCFIAVLFILLISLITLFFYFKNSENSKYIATINNDKISVEEYLLYLREQKIQFEGLVDKGIWNTEFDGVSAEELAKQKALDNIAFVKAILLKKAELGITLSENEKLDAEKKAQVLYNQLTNTEKEKISYNTVLNVMQERILQKKIYNKLSIKDKNYDFNAIYDKILKDINIEKNWDVWNSIKIKK